MRVGECYIPKWAVDGWRGGYWDENIGTGILGTGLYDGLLWTDLFGLSLVGEGSTEVGRRSEGGSTDVRVGGCCIPNWSVVGWGFSGTRFGDGFFVTG